MTNYIIFFVLCGHLRPSSGSLDWISKYRFICLSKKSTCIEQRWWIATQLIPENIFQHFLSSYRQPLWYAEIGAVGLPGLSSSIRRDNLNSIVTICVVFLKVNSRACIPFIDVSIFFLTSFGSWAFTDTSATTPVAMFHRDGSGTKGIRYWTNPRTA